MKEVPTDCQNVVYTGDTFRKLCTTQAFVWDRMYCHLMTKLKMLLRDAACEGMQHHADT